VAGITWERLESEDSVTYPCEEEGDLGEPVIFTDRFPTKSGRARFVPADYSSAAELPDQDYPYVFITGTLLEHRHTNSMTRMAAVLDAIEPGPTVIMHPDGSARLGIGPGELATVASRRGRVSAQVRVSREVLAGSDFLAFAFNEAAANIITNAALDPTGRSRNSSSCAVRIRRATA
jgi:formate dehydrogenase major subunit